MQKSSYTTSQLQHLLAAPQSGGRAHAARQPRVSRSTLRSGVGFPAILAAASLFVLSSAPAQAQSVVSACSGVSLPRSVVTNITGQVLVPVITPLQNLLGTLTFGTVNLGLAGALSNAAAGDPIRLSAVDINGNAISVIGNPNCITQSDAFELETASGIAFGGNRITGLGTVGRAANARALNAIAIGDFASTATGAQGAVAIGENASVTHVGALGSVALGQNSLATGATLATPAYLVGGTAPAEVNIGGRRLTGLAPGAADGDGVTVAQLRAAATAVTGDSLMFDVGLGAYNAQRGGAATRITNVAAGTVAAGSTDAVNGGQLNATNTTVAGNTSSITNLSTSVTGLQADALLYDGALGAYNAARGGVATRVTNVAAGTVAAGSTDAVNGGQLNATNVAVASNTTSINNLSTSVTGLQADALLYDGALGAYNAARGGVATRVTNVAAGTVAAGSTDAVNGGQLNATNVAVAGNTTSITNLGTSVTGLQADALLYDSGLQAFSASRGGAAQRITNMLAGTIGAASSDGINGAQLFGFGNSVAGALGGSSIYDPVTNQITAGIAYGGTTYGTVQGAVTAIQTSIGNLTGTGGSDLRYFNATSVRADSQANGSDSTAIGPNAIANADGSIAAGRNTAAMSAGSVAIGDGSSAIAGRAVSIGADNIASGDGAVAIGDPNIATGDGSVALGRDNQATGTGAVALGDTNFAVGDSAVALGQTNQATGPGAVAIGGANIVNGTNAVALGSGNVVTGIEALAFGVRNQVNGDGALAFGTNIMTSGTDTLAIGNDTMALGDSSAAYGNRSAATGLRSTALGTSSVASASFTTAVGETASATGYASTALGTGATASNLGSTAIGAGSSATANDSVALGGASSATRGGVIGYTAFGLTAAQTTIGEIAIARTIIFPDPITGLPQAAGERQITGVGAGSADTDAVNVAQLRGVSNSLGTALAAGLGGGATYNVTTGAVTGPTYVINGATYTNVGDALAGVSGTAATAANASVVYDDVATKDRVTLAGAGGTTLANVTAGALTATSSEAVNGSQLFATNQQVSANTAAITNLTNNMAGSTVSAVQYSNAATPTVPNGGVLTNDVTLVGANPAAPVGLHNVAAGSLAVGSTDAVNGGQIAALAAASGNALQYDRNLDGSRSNVATLVGGNAAAPVRIANVADGAVSATSTDAVNGRQLSGVSQTAVNAQTTADQALVLGRNSVQYDAGGTSVSLGLSGSPVTIRNVAAGIAPTDAVNMSQLGAGIDRAITSSNAYTDSRLAGISFDLADDRRDASGGTAAAMAMATIPQAYGPGMGMAGLGVSTWRGQSAIALGLSKANGDGTIIVKAGASYNTRGHGGAAAGIGFGF